MKSEADGVILRIITHEKPFVNAQSVEASLEDVFLYYLQRLESNYESRNTAVGRKDLRRYDDRRLRHKRI